MVGIPEIPASEEVTVEKSQFRARVSACGTLTPSKEVIYRYVLSYGDLVP